MKKNKTILFFLVRIKLTLLFILLPSLINCNNGFSSSSAQIIYLSVENKIYDYLERISLQQIITINDEIKPYSRIYIARQLKNILNERHRLNKIELEELDFYLKEYFYELNQLNIDIGTHLSHDLDSRWFMFSYEDSLFNLKLSPIAGYGISTLGRETGHSRWIGASTYFTYSDWLGINFNIRDKGEFGETVDKDKFFSPLPSAWYKNAPDGIEYSDLRGGINLNWNWGSISLLKENMQWGYGKFGQLILSSKSPSYPHIRFSIKPADWFRFTYIHGWINSLVKDSSAFYYTYPGTISERLVEEYIPKYIAANILTFTPFQYTDISLGNAIVYSGNLRPEFFIPFMFYKFLDHNTGRGNIGDGNGMMYIDVSSKNLKNFQLYSTLFVDVTEIRNILSNKFDNTWIGLTIGGKSVNALIDNLDLTLEYTRLNPWVYEHKNETTTYKHINHSLGHWLGQNADQLRFQFDYQFVRGLKIKLFAEIVRKGGLEEIYYAYSDSSNKSISFLGSPLRKDKRFGFSVSYEFMHDLFLQGNYTHSVITDEDAVRTQPFLKNSKNAFDLLIYYGL